MKRVLGAWSLVAMTALLGCPSDAPAYPVETVTLGFENDYFDLDTGDIETNFDIPLKKKWDLHVAFNALWEPHSVIFHNRVVEPARDIAHLREQKFDSVKKADIRSAVFDWRIIDESFTADRVILIVTDKGEIYKLGNPVEDEDGLSFDYQRLGARCDLRPDDLVCADASAEP